jgi:non-ribosomal peptide synthetase component F
VQYKDYAAWHNNLLQSEKMLRQQAFWLEQFSGELPVLNLPTDFPRPPVQSFKGSRLSFTMDAQLTGQMKALANKTGTTLFMLLFSAYNVLLSRYTGQEDIVVGTPVEGRRHDDLRPLIGMFVGTLAVRSRPAGDKPFDVFLEEVKHNLLEAYENQDYPFERLLEKTAVRREASRNPLFDTMFVLQNTDLSALSEAGFNAEFFEYDNNTAKFDMTVEALEQGGTIGLIIEYCTDLFKRTQSGV